MNYDTHIELRRFLIMHECHHVHMQCLRMIKDAERAYRNELIDGAIDHVLRAHGLPVWHDPYVYVLILRNDDYNNEVISVYATPELAHAGRDVLIEQEGTHESNVRVEAFRVRNK